MTIGDKLRELRIKKNLSQKDIANTFNIARQSYGIYESNNRIPDIPMLKQLALFYNVSTDYLLGRTDDSDDDKQPDLSTMSLGKRLNTLRRQNGYNYYDVQNKAGISSATQISYEQDESTPNAKTIAKYCKLYNVSADDLLGLNIDNPNEIPNEIEIPKIEFTDDDTEFLNAYCSLPQDYRERFRNNKEIIKLLQLDSSKGDAGVIEAYLILTPEERENVREDKRIKRYLNLK